MGLARVTPPGCFTVVMPLKIKTQSNRAFEQRATTGLLESYYGPAPALSPPPHSHFSTHACATARAAARWSVGRAEIGSQVLAGGTHGSGLRCLALWPRASPTGPGPPPSARFTSASRGSVMVMARADVGDRWPLLARQGRQAGRHCQADRALVLG